MKYYTFWIISGPIFQGRWVAVNRNCLQSNDDDDDDGPILHNLYLKKVQILNGDFFYRFL